MHKQNKKINKEIEAIKTQTGILEWKNIMIELKNSVESFRNRLDYAEEIIFKKFEDRSFEIS